MHGKLIYFFFKSYCKEQVSILGHLFRIIVFMEDSSSPPREKAKESPT